MGCRGRCLLERQVAVAGGRLVNVTAAPTGRADKAASRAGGRRKQRLVQPVLPPDSPDPVTLVRELNHRVKNNFQIIVSLMNLRKRMMPPERREDIRFIEEHVQSMSVAYRLVYATGSMVEVSLTELIGEVVSGLRQIAGLGEEQLHVEPPAEDACIDLDHAIALALYFAVLLPPYLDEAKATSGAVTVSIGLAEKVVTLSIRGTWNVAIVIDMLRSRLMRAYAAQLKATIIPISSHGAEQLRFRLEVLPAPLAAAPLAAPLGAAPAARLGTAPAAPGDSCTGAPPR